MAISPPLLTPAFMTLIAGHFLQALAFASMPMLPLYVEHLGASRTEVGAIMAVSSVGGLLLRPFAGWAIDAIGRRVTLIAGTLVLTAGMGLIGLVDDLGATVYVARVLIGVGSGTLFTAYFTFAADLIPPARRTEGIAIFGVSGLIPLVVNPLVTDLHLPPGDLRWVFPALGVVVLLSLVAVWPLAETRPTTDVEHAPPARLWPAMTAAALRPVWLASAVFGGLVAIYVAFATVSARNRGVPGPADLWYGYAAAAAAVRLLGPRLPDRVGPANMVAPAVGCYAGACLLAAAAEGTGGFVLSGVLAGVGHGYCFPVLTAQVVNRSHGRQRGAAMAVFTAIWEVSALGLTPLFGRLADARGDAAMFSTAACCAVALLVLWAALEHRWGPRPALGAP